MITLPKMTTSDLLDRLRRHYIKPSDPLPGGVFVEECGTNGDYASQRADALYVGFTSSSGRLLIGHELKVSRADWQHELDQPGKADRWHDACHAWYVVAPSVEIVDPKTLPHGWGLMVPSTRSTVRMQVVVKATVRPDHTPPWWAVRSVLARYDTLRAQAIRTGQHKAREQAKADVQVELEQARAGARSGYVDERTKLALEVVRVVEQLAHAEHLWAPLDAQEIALTVVDMARARLAAEDARRALDNTKRQAFAAGETMMRAAARLAEIINKGDADDGA